MPEKIRDDFGPKDVSVSVSVSVFAPMNRLGLRIKVELSKVLASAD
jgi:hypothetical protein